MGNCSRRGQYQLVGRGYEKAFLPPRWSVTTCHPPYREYCFTTQEPCVPQARLVVAINAKVIHNIKSTHTLAGQVQRDPRFGSEVSRAVAIGDWIRVGAACPIHHRANAKINQGVTVAMVLVQMMVLRSGITSACQRITHFSGMKLLLFAFAEDVWGEKRHGRTNRALLPIKKICGYRHERR